MNLISVYRSTHNPAILDLIRWEARIVSLREELHGFRGLSVTAGPSSVFLLNLRVAVFTAPGNKYEPKLAAAIKAGIDEGRAGKRKYLDKTWRGVTKIQRQWRKSISDPRFSLCRNRVIAEFTELGHV